MFILCSLKYVTICNVQSYAITKQMKGSLTMSNRLFQGLVQQMRDTMDATIGVVDENATIIACSDLTKIGTTNEFVSLDLSDSHDIFIRDG